MPLFVGAKLMRPWKLVRPNVDCKVALMPALNSAATPKPEFVTKGTGVSAELRVSLLEPGRLEGLADNCEDINAVFEVLCVDPEGTETE